MKQTIPERNNQFCDSSRFEYAQIRVYHKAGRGKHAPRYLLKCGDCDEKIEIHYAEDGLEIGGVHGSIEDWREILLPLLLIEEKNDRLVKHKPTPIKVGLGVTSRHSTFRTGSEQCYEPIVECRDVTPRTPPYCPGACGTSIRTR